MYQEVRMNFDDELGTAETIDDEDFSTADSETNDDEGS